MTKARTLSTATVLLLLCGALAISASSAATTVATVNVGQTGLGTILVDGSGRTLYLFTLDRRGSSSCHSGSVSCVVAWPPLMTTGKPHAGPGVNPALLGTIRRTTPSGLQVVYNGHPLYRSAGDKQPGDVTGQAVINSWYVVSPTGKAIKKK